MSSRVRGISVVGCGRLRQTLRTFRTLYTPGSGVGDAFFSFMSCFIPPTVIGE